MAFLYCRELEGNLEYEDEKYPRQYNIRKPTKFVVSFLPFFQEMIDEADRDGDGEINEQEFLRIMKKTSLY